MRLFITISILILLLGSAGGYVYWAQQRPDVGIILTDLSSEISVNQGQPADRGNLLGIQPLLFASDYKSRESLHLKLAAYLEKARDEGLLNAKTIAILPEHIGTWLVAAGEKPEFYGGSPPAKNPSSKKATACKKPSNG
nr:hypothetical protein [Pseudomonas sp. S9]